MDGVRLGPVDDPATDMRSLISLRQRDKVAAMMEAARAAGATIVRAGGSPTDRWARAPTTSPPFLKTEQE
jgi:betaine-aldehyde dehydrogenase